MADGTSRKHRFPGWGWLLFTLVLAGVGVALHLLLPPVPRWSIQGKDIHAEVAPNGKNVLIYKFPFDGDMIEAIEVRNVSTGKLHGSFFENKRGTSLARTRDLRRFAVVLDDKKVAFADTQDGREWTITLPTQMPPDAPAGKWLVETGEFRGRAAEHDMFHTFEHLHNRSGGEYFVFWEGRFIDWTPGNLHIVKASTGDLLETLPAVWPGSGRYVNCAKEDDLFFFFAPSKDGPAFTIWSIKERRAILTAPVVKDNLIYFDIVCDGKALLTKNTNMEQEGLLVRSDLRSGALRAIDLPFGIAFSPNGRTLAYFNSNTVELWNTDGLQKRATFKTGQVGWVKFSPDSRFIAALNDSPQHGATTISLWDAETGKPLWEKSRSAPIEKLLFSADSRFVIERSFEGVKIFDVANGEVQATQLVVEHGTTTVTTGGELVAGSHPMGRPESTLGAAGKF